MIIKTQNEIRKIINTISNEVDVDVYYFNEYIKFYLNDNNEYNVFFSEQNGKLLFIPYIKTFIRNSQNYYDIETPYGYGGPILNTNDKAFIQESWNNFKSLLIKDKVVAGLLRFNPFFDIQKFTSLEKLEIIKQREIVILNLENSEESIFQNFSKDNRNKIKKAIKSNLILEKCRSLHDLREFSKIYIKRMNENKALDMYYFGDKYFEKISNLGSNFVENYILKKDNEIIGGAIVLKNKNHAHYHLSSCKSEYFNLGPNNFMRYQVILDLKRQNLKVLNFGGGKTNNSSDTLLSFKKKFSSETLWFYIGKYIFNEEIYKDIILNWEKNNSEKKHSFKNYILKYRF